MNDRPVIIVAAMGPKREIGKDGGLPWPRCPADMARFRDATRGRICIMGRKTAATVGPMPGRQKLILSSDPTMYPGRTVTSLAQAIEHARAMMPNFPAAVIGGALLYKEALPLARAIYLTRFPTAYPDCDTFFPELGPEWEVAHSRQENGLVFERLVPRS